MEGVDDMIRFKLNVFGKTLQHSNKELQLTTKLRDWIKLNMKD